MPPPKEARPGVAVDTGGYPVIDPTKNVLDLVSAQQTRIDDLAAAETRRINDAIAAETRRVNELAAQKAEYEKELRAAQSGAVDVVRQDLSERIAEQGKRLTDSDIRIEGRLAALEKYQAEGVGKGTVRDPMYEQLSQKLDSLVETRSVNTGQSQGSAATWAMIISAVSFAGMMITLIRSFVP